MTEFDEVIVELGFSAPGTLTEASVHYRAFLDGQWRQVVRYDNAHGTAYRHQYGPGERIRPYPGMDATELVRTAREDLLRNWPRYRALAEAAR